MAGMDGDATVSAGGSKQFYGVAYKITNIVTKKSYIGVTGQQPKQRWIRHWHQTKGGRNTFLCRSMKKYGQSNFIFDVIASSVSRKDLYELEKILIKQHNTYWTNGVGYNLTIGGEGPEGHSHTKETKEKMSKTRKGRKFSEDHKSAISKSLTGRKLSEKHCESISTSRKGISTPKIIENLVKARSMIKGNWKMSDEGRASISKKSKERKRSKEQMKKMYEGRMRKKAEREAALVVSGDVCT